MSALAVFICRPNSHPFQERRVSLHEEVKIGRSVARARPAPNNAVFDCKVLSRNHALLWYDSNSGKFYLQDTKSSNGTFINNQRLSKGSEESAPHEIFSGDIVQFGVDVMENSRRVTHGCIIATIKVYYPDGREGKPRYDSNSSPFLSGPSPPGATLQAQELYQLAQYLQEALHREQMLENKLAALQRLVQNTQEASESGWQALIDEDRLLSRLEVLENQLQAYSKNQTEDSLRQELVALQEDKYNYETTAKESLRKVLQEKLDAVRKLAELERSLSNTEDECCHLKDMCEASQKELQELAEKHQEQLAEMQALQEKLKEAEKHHAEELEAVEKVKAELQEKIDEMLKQENLLTAKVEAVQADNDFTKEQLTNMKARMEAIKEKNGDIDIPEMESQGVQVDLVNLLDLQMLQNQSDDEDDMENGQRGILRDSDRADENGDSHNGSLGFDETPLKASSALSESTLTLCESTQVLGEAASSPAQRDSPTSPPTSPSRQTQSAEEKLQETQDQIKHYKAQLKESEARLKESKEAVEKLQRELEQAQIEAVSHQAKISTLEDTLKLSDMHMNQVVENAVADLKIQLNESRKQADNSNELARQLKEEIGRLEADMSQLREEADRRNTLPGDTTDVTNSNSLPCNHREDASPNHLRDELDRLNELLQEARDAQRKSEAEVERCKCELEEATRAAKKSSEEAKHLQVQLNDAQKLAKDRSDDVSKLREQLNKAEFTTKEVKTHILTLRDRLLEEQEVTRKNNQEAERLRKQLLEAQQTAKQSKNEAEQLRSRLLSIQAELDAEKCGRRGPTTTASTAANHVAVAHERALHAVRGKAKVGEGDVNLTDEDRVELAAHAAQGGSTEFAALKEECASLRQRIQDIEQEMSKSRKENAALQADYARLQASYKELEELKDKLEVNEVTWRMNLTDAQKDAEQTKNELKAANTEIALLRDKCSAHQEELSRLTLQLTERDDDYHMLAYKSKTLSACSMIPLLMLLFAILLALYPTLAKITATSTLT